MANEARPSRHASLGRVLGAIAGKRAEGVAGVPLIAIGALVLADHLRQPWRRERGDRA